MAAPPPRSAGTPLSLKCDDEQLSEYQMLVRKQLEVFEAQPEDVESNTQGRKKQVVLGQVGLRCRHVSAIVSFVCRMHCWKKHLTTSLHSHCSVPAIPFDKEDVVLSTILQSCKECIKLRKTWPVVISANRVSAYHRP